MNNKQSHIIGSREISVSSKINFDRENIHNTNIQFWNKNGSDILGETALPHYGAFITDKDYKLFEHTVNKKVLEIGCGSGKSLAYVANFHPEELWGIDISEKQIDKTKTFLAKENISATLICSPMEQKCEEVQDNYFDLVYSIYAIGWSTDLDLTFSIIASYLKKDGQFIFSWSHPIHKCVATDNDKLVFRKNYFDESWYEVSLGDSTLTLADRKLSTYINALAKAGFVIEQLIEESDEEIIRAADSEFAKKASILPVTFVIKARKL